MEILDIATLLGLLGGVGMLILGFTLEDGNPGSLVKLSPIVIVFGGLSGTLLVSFTIKEIVKIPSLILAALKLPKENIYEQLDFLDSVSESARKNGLLSLEKIINSEEITKFDPIIERGLQLVIDGAQAETIRDILEADIETQEIEANNNAFIFECAGGYAPTIGIIGTVMGLVQVLGSLSEPDKLGNAIAAAFIATLYGVASANLIFFPIGTKLKSKFSKEKRLKEMAIMGILAIQAGENHIILTEKLKSFLTTEELNERD